MDIIVKYGSKARGDSDSFSDNDFLVVGKMPNRLLSSKSDIVRYTTNRLEKLREARSLFLIHLREEGVILKDHNSWMKIFLKTIPDYTPDDEILGKACQNLSIITSIVPSPSGVPCWFDMLFVFLRDLLVKLNALKKNYVFAPDCLLRNIDIKNKTRIQNVLNISRKIKSNYRNGVNQNIFISPLEVAELVFDSFNLNNVCIDFHNIIKNPMGLDPYLLLRLVEYGICTGYIRCSNKKLIKYIKNPHRYPWDIKQRKWLDSIIFIEPNHSRDRLQPAASAGR
jgi:hypothetical protein